MPSGNIILTGARGRLASVLAQNLGSPIVPVSRTGGEGFLLYEDLLHSGLLRQPGVVLHTAWSSVPATAGHHPESAWTEDLPLIAKLLVEMAAAPAESRPLFVLFSSGGAIYGERSTPAIETDAPSPHGWYGLGKLAAEQLVTAFAAQNGIDTCILRISNPYGFSFSPEKPQGIVGAALHALKSGRPLSLLGDGVSRKDFLHMEDLTAAIRMVIEKHQTGCFNICSDQSTSMRELLAIIENIVEKKIPTQSIPAAEWDVQSSLLSGRKFESFTGWKPRWTLEDGLASVVLPAFKS